MNPTMKKITFLLFTAFVILFFTELSAQNNGEERFPFHPESFFPTDYGTDVIIYPNPAEDQVKCRVSVASNGWIYAAYMISTGGFRVARSIDDGQTWTHSSKFRSGFSLTSVDIVAIGNDAGNIKVWIINSGYMSSSIDVWEVAVQELNGDLSNVLDHSIESMISNDGYYGVAIATDYAFPSAGTSPYSLAVLYSKAGNAADNIIFKSSSTGNAVFNSTHTIASSGKYFTDVALAFGRSFSYPDGKYFAAWHKQIYAGWAGDYEGEIYTSFTTDQYNGSWKAPIRIDNLVESGAGNCNHPSISCQVNNTNNLVSGISAIVLFDRKSAQAPNNKNGVVGVYNLNPIFNATWNNFSLESLLDTISEQPDIVFDTLQNIFYATWFNSTGKFLKCAYQSVDITTPSAWSLVSGGYNDSPNLSSPFPRVEVNAKSHQVINVWIGQQSSGNGNATFDGTSITASLPNQGQNGINTPMIFSPNPANDHVKISFEAKSACYGNLKIVNQINQVILTSPQIIIKPGKNEIELNVMELRQGVYFCLLSAGDQNLSGKLLIAN
jgi:hypothetical protein